MAPHDLARRAVAGAWRRLREGAVALGGLARRAAEELAYYRAELVVIGLLAGSLLGGFAVELWRQRDPAALERLEAEPPRLAPGPPPPGPRRVPVRRGARVARPGVAAPLPEDTPLDLNRATANELTRLPGIGPALAARIVARRQARGGRFESADELATVPGVGDSRANRLRGRVVVTETAPLGAARASPSAPVDAEARDPLEPWEPP